MKLLTIQAGKAQQIGDPQASSPMDSAWTSALYKEQAAGPVEVTASGLPGDEHVYEGHGGPDKAVLISAVEHYAFWQETLGLEQMPHGGFGENFTTNGLLEWEVCIGDTYQVGEQIILQVTQARPPCWKLGRRYRVIDLPQQMEETGRTGIFLRVLEAGRAQAGDQITLLERPNPGWTAARAYQIYRDVASHLAEARQLLRLPGFSEHMRLELEKYISQGFTDDPAPRMIGPNA